MAGEQVSVGRVFSRGFGVIADNPATVLGIAFLLGGIPLVIYGFFQQSLASGEMDPDQMLGYMGVTLGSVLVSLVFQAIAQGALIRATVAYANGERASFGESLSAGLAVALPLIGLSIVMALGVGLGFLLLIVPGIILYVIWSVATPALVAERIGVFDALGRSRELTRGVRWPVFGVIAIMVVGSWIVSGIFGAVVVGTTGFSASGMAELANEGPSVGWILVEGILSTVTIAVWSTVVSALYLELRTAKEGPEGQALADIFS